MSIHWHILGAGAIGGLFALRLHQLGLDVTLLSRSSDATHKRLRFIDGDSEFSIDFRQQAINKSLGNASLSTNTFETHVPEPNGEPIDYLLVATKSFDATNAVKAVADRLSANAVVVLLCNGMGYHADIADAIAPAKVIAATTTAGCARPSADVRVLTGIGETRLGWLGASATRTPAWFDHWATTPWNCRWDNDIEQALLRKVAINAVINPSTALHNIANGELLEPHFKSVFDQATAEVVALLSWSGNSGLAEELPEQVAQVARGTAKNTSSMRADVLAGRKTEINAIVGYLLSQLCAEPGNPRPRPQTPLLSEWLNALQQPIPGRE